MFFFVDFLLLFLFFTLSNFCIIFLARNDFLYELILKYFCILFILLNVNKFQNFCTIEAHNFTLIHLSNSRKMWIQIIKQTMDKIRYKGLKQYKRCTTNVTGELLNGLAF